MFNPRASERAQPGIALDDPVRNRANRDRLNVVPVGTAKRLQEGSREALVSYLRRFALLGGMAAGLIVGVAAVAPVFWLELLYGAEFVEYAHLVLWWAVAFMLRFLNSPVVFGLRALEQTQSLFWGQFWVAIFSVVCSYPLIHYFGLLGPMIGFVLIALIRTSIFIVAFKKHVSRLA